MLANNCCGAWLSVIGHAIKDTPYIKLTQSGASKKVNTSIR